MPATMTVAVAVRPATTHKDKQLIKRKLNSREPKRAPCHDPSLIRTVVRAYMSDVSRLDKDFLYFSNRKRNLMNFI